MPGTEVEKSNKRAGGPRREKRGKAHKEAGGRSLESKASRASSYPGNLSVLSRPIAYATPVETYVIASRIFH
jgi:hypothetical protein